MSERSVPTTIESFPTELWCEVFKFFDAIELYRMFNGLNSRINSILSESTPLYFQIATRKDDDLSSGVILPSVNNYANVKSFKFYDEFQIEEFFTLWPINIFSQLRYLSLVYLGALMSDCSIELLEQLSTLKHFECLDIKVGYIVYNDKYLKRLLQLIFVENDVFHSLKQFVFQTNNNTFPLPLTTKQTMLQFLTVPSLDHDKFLQLLPYIPHIKSIKTNSLFTGYKKATPVTRPSLHSALPNCLHLNSELDSDWTFEDIQFLLQQVPNLNHLKLTCSYLLSNGNKWEMLLASNCSKLQTFQLIFYYSYGDALTIFTELQNSFSTMFWLERNVQFEQNEKRCRLIVRF